MQILTIKVLNQHYIVLHLKTKIHLENVEKKK